MVHAIKFYADWCGPCKVLGPQMEKSGLPYTKVNVDNDTEVTYTILGVHDSDPNNGIISFKSPLGAELLGREVDDEIEVNDTQYEIIKIVAKKLQ